MRVEVLKADITSLDVEAIVNAANPQLAGGGGVDGAIHAAGGASILAECRTIIAKIGKLEAGGAKITTSGLLKCKNVIHTVGPIWRGGGSGEAEKLRNCYLNSLALAVEKGLKSLAFPNISTGVYGYPKPLAVDVAVEAVLEFTRQNRGELEKILFVCYDEENLKLYRQKLKKIGVI